jgi:hypothetical protein
MRGSGEPSRARRHIKQLHTLTRISIDSGRQTEKTRPVTSGIALLVAAAPGSVQGQAPQFEPGAAGAGDPYFPLDGNGGYNARHYVLDITYNPATDVLDGVATIRLRAMQNLSRFNLDFDGLRVQSITVDGRPATWTRGQGELRITPREGSSTVSSSPS